MLVHIHIPKNAGSTINAILRRNFGNRYTEFYTNRCGRFLSNSEFIELIDRIRENTNVLSGHDIHPLDAEISRTLDIDYFTFIRHPVNRAISLYYYERRTTTGTDDISQYSFREYVIERPKYDNAISNWQVYNIAGKIDFEQAKKLLEQFITVGVVEQFDKSLVLLREVIGIPDFNIYYEKSNVSKEREMTIKTLPEDILEKLMEMNQEDLKLFEYANNRLKQDIEKIQGFTYKKNVFRVSNYIYQCLVPIHKMRRFPVTVALKKNLKKAFCAVGLEVHRINTSSQSEKESYPSSCYRPQRGSLLGILQHAKNVGLSPVTILDVGAAYGSFTSSCQTIFPNARYILVEPLEEYAPFLQSVITSLSHAEYVKAAATDKSGSVVINVHPDLVSSSLYKEEKDFDVKGVERVIPGITLDEICKERKATGAYLIKIDTQGAELNVLSGAENILQETEFIILEVSLFKFFKGRPQFYDCITFMKEQGFVVYDIFDLQYHSLDGPMSQVNIAFVRDNSQFRKFHFYATREQRKQQNQYFREEIS